MKTLGLDIGTTTVSAVVVEDGTVLSSVTLKNDAFLPAKSSWERLQDPAVIRSSALQAVRKLLTQHPDVAGIGVTGQMHGILYLDNQGVPVSPLYTWQDGRGDLPYDDHRSYAAYLSQLTGYALSTGFGMVTHFYNHVNDLVPQTACVFCTIQDYIAMVLTGCNRPVTEASDAASFGLFLVKDGCYDDIALNKAGIAKSMVPTLATSPYIGLYEGRIPVFAAIGDNQASFLGATGGDRNCMLANIGTGGQFSVFSPTFLDCPGLETRPFPGGGYLIVGSSLCGGRAYALMENFLRDVLENIAGIRTDSCYEAMEQVLAGAEKPENLPCTLPLFRGTREDPTCRASITNLDADNFALRHLLWSMLEGMAAELYDVYRKYAAQGGMSMKLIGSGNGLRKNLYLQQCFTNVFHQPLTMSACMEEAATGAAIYAAGNL